MQIYKVRIYNERENKYEMAYAMSESGRDSVIKEFEERLKSGFKIASIRKCNKLLCFCV